MTAPWAALALLWGSLCAGKDGARLGGAGRARGAGLGSRAVFTNKGRTRGLRATCTRLAPTRRSARDLMRALGCAVTCGETGCRSDALERAGRELGGKRGV